MDKMMGTKVITSCEELASGQAKNFWSKENQKKIHMDHLDASVTEVTDRALLLDSYSMLSQKNIDALIIHLESITSPFQPNSCTAVAEKVLEKALMGTESECQVLLKLLLPLLDHSAFKIALEDSKNYIRNILFTRIPTVDELRQRVKRKSAISKLYYLKSSLYELEIMVRKLKRAAFIAGVLFLRKVEKIDEFIHAIIQTLIPGPTLRGSATTLQSFHAVCSILIAISEQRYTWGFMNAPDIDRTLMSDLEFEFGNFISFRDRESAEAMAFTIDIFSRAFKDQHPESDDWNPPDCSWIEFDAPKVKHPEPELMILEYHYSTLYKTSFHFDRRIFLGVKAPQFFPGNPTLMKPEAHNWQRDIEDISILIYYGIQSRLAVGQRLQEQDEAKLKEQRKIIKRPPRPLKMSSWFTEDWFRRVRGAPPLLPPANPQVVPAAAAAGPGGDHVFPFGPHVADW